jgi:NAD(P)H-hydrate repair Nnr-like enzyme with NAD(P)H-hydrate dehydratase domain
VQDVCAYAAWTHGRAAELASPEGQALPAADLVQVLGLHARSGCW